MPWFARIWLPVLLCCVLSPPFVTANGRFRSWFPRYELELNYIVDHNCSQEYAEWHGPNYVTPIWRHSGRAGPLINCILTATPEVVKANFNSAAVVLGLMPALLALVGPGIQETSTLLAFGDRPLLALIICLGTPLIGLDRELHIRGSFRTLNSRSPASFGLRRSLWLTCLQYSLALAAIANIAEVTSELAIKTAFSWFKGDAYVIGIWAFIGFITHLWGALTLSTTTHMGKDIDLAGVSSTLLTRKWLRWRFSFAKREQPVHVVVQPASLLYFLSVALVTFFILFQIFFGTIVFASILFIGVHNAVQVWIRYMSSVMVCRVLVLMELGFIQNTVEIVDARCNYAKVSQVKTGEV